MGTAWLDTLVASMSNSWTAQKTTTSSSLNFGRIAKPLRGGGGASASPPTPIAGGSSASPLSRLQNEDAGYVLYAFSCPLNLTYVFFWWPDLVSLHLGGN